jgi:TonB family protein
MPVNVTKIGTSVSLAIFGLTAIINAQTQASSPEPVPQAASINTVKTPSAADVMRDRISKAKANIAVRNYPAALYELENIKRETSDASVHAVVNVLMMNAYIEQGEYKRAEDLLKTHFESYKRNNANAHIYYQSVAAQVVKSARNQAERYRALGLTVSDRNLPLEAVNDIEQMRGMVETVVEQAKETSADKAKAPVLVPLLEEAMATRAAIARDDYDARRWRDAAADAREQMASSQSVVINATDGKPFSQPATQTVAAAPVVFKPVESPTNEPVKTPSANLIAANNTGATDASTKPSATVPTMTKTVETPTKPAVTERPIKTIVNAPVSQPEKKMEPKSQDLSADGSLTVGSLIDFATSRSKPTYPSIARSVRATGVVRVDIVVDEKGEVAEIKNAAGHAMLQSAARDAIRRWKFKPFTHDGQPVKATGFVNFNFSL